MNMTNKTITHAVQELDELNRAFSTNRVSAVEHGATRGRILAEALESMAADFGVRLQTPMHIDGNGEFSIVAMNEGGTNPAHYGTGKYGAEFAALLSPHGPRTGIQPAASISADNGWCRMNHFNVERMIRHYAAQPTEEERNDAVPRG